MKLKLILAKKWLNYGIIATVSLMWLIINSQQALAHHAMGGKIPSNFFEGFLSGLAHPIIGLDHFAFVCASGLLAVFFNYGIFIPLGFVISTMIGTLIHLQSINLPFPEIVIAASVILFGVLLALKKGQNSADEVYLLALASLGLIAGIFHGYAYGESIIGAQMTPLVAYLAGFMVIQLIIALLAFKGGQILLEKLPGAPIRWIGWGISTIGGAFLTSIIIA